MKDRNIKIKPKVETNQSCNKAISEGVSGCVLYTEHFSGNTNALINVTDCHSSAKSSNSVSMWIRTVFNKAWDFVGHISLTETLI